MYSVLILISIIISVFLIIIILMQASKGGGLAGTFGGAGGIGGVFGTRRTADFLSRATWWLGGILLGLAIIINLFFLPGKMTAEQRESIIQNASRNNTVPQGNYLPEQIPQDNQQ
ncbi:MAG: preprotein translocase subunit SecG [Ignavibacteriales bacterium]|nr:preprotein translocase subunit SecG [Ignavibacteriales bacterium]